MININNLYIIIEHFNDFEVEFLEDEEGITLPEDLEEAIAFCEENECSHYIAYNLLKLKLDLQTLEDEKQK